MRLTREKLHTILNKGKTLNVFISDRSGRKSSVVQEEMIERAMNDEPFILLRSKKDESITEHWLSSYIKELAERKGLVFWTESADQNIQAIYFKHKENEEKYLFCYGMWLSLDKKYKSNFFDGFEKVKYVVWEECIPNEPINQNIRFVSLKCMKEIKRVMSIYSTVARERKDVQCIFLGNDIAENIINPITVAFDLLERLTPNCEIEDKCIIDEREYSYYFNYFDFDGAVNHWLNNIDYDIDNNVDISKYNCYNFTIKTNFKDYYLYNCNKFLYISDVKGKEQIQNTNNAREFFECYKATHLYEQYPLNTALVMLITFYNVPQYEVIDVFGENYKTNPSFTKKEQIKDEKIINISELAKTKINKIMEAPNFKDIISFNQLIKNNTVIYSNIKVKLDIEALSLTMMLYDI